MIPHKKHSVLTSTPDLGPGYSISPGWAGFYPSKENVGLDIEPWPTGPVKMAQKYQKFCFDRTQASCDGERSTLIFAGNRSSRLAALSGPVAGPGSLNMFTCWPRLKCREFVDSQENHAVGCLIWNSAKHMYIYISAFTMDLHLCELCRPDSPDNWVHFGICNFILNFWIL